MTNPNQNESLQQIAENLAEATGTPISGSNLNSSQLLRAIALQTQELAGGGVSSGYPAPHITKVFPTTIVLGHPQVVEIEGSFFTPDTTINVEGFTVDNIKFFSSNLIKVYVTALNLGIFDLILNNGKSLTINQAIEVIDLSDLFVDLRAGGTEFTDSAIEIAEGMTWTRTAWGFNTAGGNNWGKWVRFLGDNDRWVQNRNSETLPNLNLIVQVQYGMIGYGSNEMVESSTTQYRQAEIVVFFNSATSIYGFYGNNGDTGNIASFASGVTLPENIIIRLKFEKFGQPGSIFRIYQLPSNSKGWRDQDIFSERQFIAANSNVSDWINTDNLLEEIVISSNMKADEKRIMPCLLPHSPELNLLGFYYD